MEEEKFKRCVETHKLVVLKYAKTILGDEIGQTWFDMVSDILNSPHYGRKFKLSPDWEREFGTWQVLEDGKVVRKTTKAGEIREIIKNF